MLRGTDRNEKANENYGREKCVIHAANYRSTRSMSMFYYVLFKTLINNS